ncbi:MAG TPA: GNAT family N-acetyltransferase [Xanthobacteraceae bacterium]|nr:GNAT family N-acetyltransferase [Xanthobacteraceae bacterium]
MLAPRDTAVSTEWRPLADLAGLAAEWRALARRAAERNVFYEPDFALPAAEALAPDIGAVLVRGNEPHRLIGVFPCRILRRRYGVRLPLLAAWTHPFAPLGTPLVDHDAVAPAVAGFLDHIADDARLPKLLLLPCQVEDGPVAAAFAAAIARRGGRSAAFGRHQRALLAPSGARVGYLEAALGGKKRKELRRQRRRLDEAGSVAFTMAREPAEVTAALADFLALETRGWKGRAGTAAAQDGTIRQFIEAALAGLAAHGQARVARLVSGDRTVAMGIMFTSGSGAWFWKIAYDEDVSRASPGVQLTLDLTDAILRDGAIEWCDSCASAEHAMIDSIWRERRTLVDHLIALESGLQFALVHRSERIRRRAHATARKLRDLLARP